MRLGAPAQDGEKERSCGEHREVDGDDHAQAPDEGLGNKVKSCQELPGEANTQARHVPGDEEYGSGDRKREDAFHVFFRREHRVGDGKEEIKDERKNRPVLQDTLLRSCKRVSCEAKGVYWLNIMDRSFPFLAVVAHTNMIDKKYYGGHHITYFGNYLPSGHPYLSMTKDQLLNIFLPFIKRLNPSFLTSSVIGHTSFLGLFAQPVHELHYSRRAPKLETPIPGIYLANMDSIYPWDRGTNYAVELGVRAARLINE